MSRMTTKTAESILERARAGFADRFNRKPAGVWSAPGRVNLIGEHTDYNDGYVLPFGIDRRTWVALAPRADQTVRVASDRSDGLVEHSLADVTHEAVTGWSAYPLGTAWGLGQVGADLGSVPGFDAFFVSDVPVGAGLSSSAALECALAVALNEVWRLRLDSNALVRATHLAENHIVGAPTGILDQSASLLARSDAAVFLDCRSGASRAVSLGLELAGLAVLVIDTRVEHAHATGGYADRRASCEKAARALGVAALRDVAPDDLARAAERLDPLTMRRARHIVTENERVLATVHALENRDYVEVGRLMVDSHTSLRLDFEVTVPELDLAGEAAVRAGALGARMTGGGFGGSVIALVRGEDGRRIAADVDAAFAERGLTQPAIFPVAAREGAGRDL